MKANRLVLALLLLLCVVFCPSVAEQIKLDAKEFEDLKTKAEHSDVVAQYNLGTCYENGNAVAQDLAEAVRWYRKAADQGFAPGQGELAKCYQFGFGVTQDAVEAVKWWRKAAEQGNAKAQFSLGNCYLNGDGITTDKGMAVKWYRKAAEQGYAEAECNLGMCYAKGEGVIKDSAEAVRWIRMAAEQGVAIAQYNLAQSYSEGDIVPKDAVQAVKWYRKAAEQGLAEAQYNLGVRYANGDGVLKDFVEAYKWMNIGLAQGFELAGEYFELAKKHRLSLEHRMTAEQIAEAQRLSSGFKPRRKLDFGASITSFQPSASGTGFFITNDGFLVTNEHVVRDAAQIRLRTGAGLISAKVVKVDAANDLALLKAEGKFSALPVAASRGVKLGGTVATVGFPNIGLQGFAPKLAKGEIASLSGAGDDVRYFQISVPVQPGNSGGALMDERGNVVGVVAAKLNTFAALVTSGSLPENVNYAVKSSYLLSFLESVPEVAAKLKAPNTREMKFEDVVKAAEQAAVLVLVY